MLENLDHVDWQNTQMLGRKPATEVPKYLRQLAYSNTCKEASEFLKDWLADGEETSDAALRAMPFILEILFNSDTRCKQEVLAFVCSRLCLFYSDNNVASVRKIILDELPKLLGLLNNPDFRIRKDIAYYLMCIPEHWGQISAVLRQQFFEEPQEIVKVQILYSLARLDSDIALLDEQTASLEQVSENLLLIVRVLENPNESKPLRYSAALASIFLKLRNPTPDLMALVLDSVEEYDERIGLDWWSKLCQAFEKHLNMLIQILTVLVEHPKASIRRATIPMISFISRNLRSSSTQQDAYQDFSEWAFPQLKRFIYDQDREIRREAVREIQGYGKRGRKTINELLVYFNDPAAPPVSTDTEEPDGELQERVRFLRNRL